MKRIAGEIGSIKCKVIRKKWRHRKDHNDVLFDASGKDGELTRLF